MPMPAPHTLSADDVYALTAYILHLNDVVSSDFVADRDSLPKVKMPNRDSFVWIDPRPDTMAQAMHERLRRPEGRQDHVDGGRSKPDATARPDRSIRCSLNKNAGKRAF